MSEYYRIKQFSQLTSTTIKTLLYYDRIGLLKPSQKTMSGYRLYTDQDMFRLMQIMVLKFLCYPLMEIKKIVAKKNFDIKGSLIKQSYLLEKKSSVALNTKWLLNQVLESLEKSNSLNWQILIELMKLLQKDEDHCSRWQFSYFSESVCGELAQITLKNSREWWDDYYRRWGILFKEVEAQLHTDPKGETGQALAKKWLDLRDEVEASPEVKKISWEAFQKSAVPQQVFPYDPRVIEYITQATHIKQS